MEARARPPRKMFFSAKGRMSGKIAFLTEPIWAQDDEERDVLQADVQDLETNENVRLEQYCPDAYDLSQALVATLGNAVVGKRAAIVARGATRRTNDGRSVNYIEGFEVTAL